MDNVVKPDGYDERMGVFKFFNGMFNNRTGMFYRRLNLVEQMKSNYHSDGLNLSHLVEEAAALREIRPRVFWMYSELELFVLLGHLTEEQKVAILKLKELARRVYERAQYLQKKAYAYSVKVDYEIYGQLKHLFHGNLFSLRLERIIRTEEDFQHDDMVDVARASRKEAQQDRIKELDDIFNKMVEADRKEHGWASNFDQRKALIVWVKEQRETDDRYNQVKLNRDYREMRSRIVQVEFA